MNSTCQPQGRSPKPEPGAPLGSGLHGAFPDFLPAARLATSLEGVDIASVQQQRQEQSYFVRLGSLSERLRRRAYAHSLGKLQRTRQRAQEALAQLAQALSLVRPPRRPPGPRSRSALPPPCPRGCGPGGRRREMGGEIQVPRRPRPWPSSLRVLAGAASNRVRTPQRPRCSA